VFPASRANGMPGTWDSDSLSQMHERAAHLHHPKGTQIKSSPRREGPQWRGITMCRSVLDAR